MKTIGLVKNFIQISLRLKKTNYNHHVIITLNGTQKLNMIGVKLNMFENKGIVYGFGDAENRVLW